MVNEPDFQPLFYWQQSIPLLWGIIHLEYDVLRQGLSMIKLTCEDLYELLDQIKLRPELYLGMKSLIKLRHFLDGVLHVLALDEQSDCLDFLKGFQEWIEIRYDIDGSHHWSSIINFYASNEADAFDIFFKHLSQFLSLDTSVRDYLNLLQKREDWLEAKASCRQNYEAIQQSVWNGPFYDQYH
jgi:hypothetical protein